jgi:hypothetical protein
MEMCSDLLMFFYDPSCIYDSSCNFFFLYFVVYCFFPYFCVFSVGMGGTAEDIRLLLHDKIEGWEYEALGYSTGVVDYIAESM